MPHARSTLSMGGGIAFAQPSMEHVAPMLLDDPRLNFASDLIAHWTEIRGSSLVPFDMQINPAKMIRAVPFITITRLTGPQTAEVRLAEFGLRRRHGRDITRTNIYDLLAPQYRWVAETAMRLFVSVPCGIYYTSSISNEQQAIIREGETLSLPLRTINSASPDMTIAVTRDVPFKGVADPATSAVHRLNLLSVLFVDIGAGVPDELPIDAA